MVVFAGSLVNSSTYMTIWKVKEVMEFHLISILMNALHVLNDSLFE